jgi:hypothetical protein
MYYNVIVDYGLESQRTIEQTDDYGEARDEAYFEYDAGNIKTVGVYTFDKNGEVHTRLELEAGEIL